MEIEDWLGADNTLGIEIWNKKYRNGNETFEEWLDRVSGRDEEVKRLIREKKFLFGGRILANRNANNSGTLSNCYALSMEDSIESIFDLAKDMALTYKSGGGVGIDVSVLAPEGAKVNNPAKSSTGAVSFIDLFTTTTGLIGQCVEGSQRVITQNGLVPIEDVKVGDGIWTDLGFKAITNKVESGVKPVYRVTTRMGYSVVTTDNHIFTVPHEEGGFDDAELKELKVGSEVVLLEGTPTGSGYVLMDTGIPGVSSVKLGGWRHRKIRCENHRLPEVLDDRLGYLFGCIYAKGFIDSHGHLSIDCGKVRDVVISKICKLSESLFGYMPHLQISGGDWISIEFDGVKEGTFLIRNGYDVSSPEIPDMILKSPFDVQRAFIAGLFDIAGSASYTIGYSYATPSQGVAKEVQLLLNINKVFSEIIDDPHSSPRFEVRISDDGCRRLSNEVFTQSVYTFRISTCGVQKNEYTPFNDRLLGFGNATYRLPLGAIQAMIKHCSVYKVISVIDSIASIESIGEMNTYDITVDEAGRFWCEGFYLHNCGRRGALMVSMSCDHPDIDKFIQLKTDVNKATTANLSIKVSDDFMRAVQNGEKWYCAFTRPETKECISKSYDAVELYKIFCDANYDYGEPGLLFWDRIKTYNMLNCYSDFEYCCTNPCFAGNTLILTDEGYQPIESLCDRKVNIWNGYQWSKVAPQITGYNQPMYRVTMSNGAEIECTDYHKFILKGGERIECRNLIVGDKLEKFSMPVIEGYDDINSDIAYTNGFYSGDGFFPKDHKNPRIILYGVKADLKDFFDCKHYTPQADGSVLVYLDNSKGMNDGFDKTFVPDARYTIRTRLAWLSGIVDSDGSLNDAGGSLNITSINRSFLNRIRLMLNTLGVMPSVGLLKKEMDKPLPDGHGGTKVYHCKESYRLVIAASDVVKLVALGFSTHRVPLIANPARDAKRFITVTRLEKISNASVVYCMTEPIHHSVIANGVMTAQCGELPLPDGGACLLGSMNLAEYVKDNNEFDYISFKQDVKTAICALDTVLDEGAMLHPLKVQRESVLAWRQTGLGIMGLGDMLIKKGIRYGSSASLILCDTIGKVMAEAALSESEYLGREKGSFPRFDAKKTAESEYFSVHSPEGYVPESMRNSQLLAIAPTGSISTMLGVSGGIEPLFALEYTRTTKSLNGTDETFIVVPKVVQDARDAGNDECLVCAQTLDYKERINMQSIWQKHIDGAISSTINLPNDFPKESIGDLYMLAWEKGLKGVTIFRDGCKRAGILNVKKDDDEKTPEAKAVEEYLQKNNKIPIIRSVVQPIDAKPENLIGKKRKLMTGCGSLHVSAFFDKESGDLREVFLSRGSLGGCLNYMTGVSRLISLSARAGCTTEEIVDQLKSCGACPSYAVRRATKGDTSIGSCCPMAVGNALLEMHEEMMKEIGNGAVFSLMKDEPPTYVDERLNELQKQRSINPCPQCGAELHFTGGCLNCDNCGWSRCG